jgi:hypothetical protein
MFHSVNILPCHAINPSKTLQIDKSVNTPINTHFATLLSLPSVTAVYDTLGAVLQDLGAINQHEVGVFVQQSSSDILPDVFLGRSATASRTQMQAGFRQSLQSYQFCCRITGSSNVEAAHIFPYWKRKDLLATLAQAAEEHPDWNIPQPWMNTVFDLRNGVLLRSDLHGLFDNFSMYIDPEVNCFNSCL